MHSLSTKLDQQLSVLERYVTPARSEKFNEVLAHRTEGLTLLLDRVSSPHNISAIMRTADAFGIATVHLISPGFSPNTGISLGTEQWVEVVNHTSEEEALDALSDYALAILVSPKSEGTHRVSKTIDLSDFRFSKPLAFVLGNEKEGVSPSIVSRADFSISIPMLGFVESLNVSVTAGICLFAAHLNRIKSGEERPTLSLDKQRELRLKWLKNQIRGADLILDQVGLITEPSVE